MMLKLGVRNVNVKSKDKTAEACNWLWIASGQFCPLADPPVQIV